MVLRPYDIALLVGVAAFVSALNLRTSGFQPTLPPTEVQSALGSCGVNSSLLVNSSSTDFASLTTKFAQNVNYTRTARVFALPQIPGDVSSLVQCIGQKGIPFEIVSGGHKMDLPNENAPPGLIINMEKFSSIDYHPSAGTVTCGAGLRWRDTTKGTRMPVGGRASHVGLSGFLLDGGDSWLSSQHGFATQNIASMEVVLANGTAVTASTTQNVDLFNALRGSAGQVGIVTSFELFTYPICPTQYGGSLEYAPENTTALAEAANKLLEKDPSGMSNVVITFLGGGGVVLQEWYNGTAALVNQSGVFADFDRLPHTAMPMLKPPGETDFSGVNELDDPVFVSGRSMMNAVPINSLKPEMFVRTQYRLHNLTTSQPQFNLTSIYIEPLKHGVVENVPVPGAAWPPDEGYMAAIIGFTVAWTDPKYDDEGAKATTLLRKQLTQDAQELGLLNDAKTCKPLAYFTNYAKFGADDKRNALYIQVELA